MQGMLTFVNAGRKRSHKRAKRSSSSRRRRRRNPLPAVIAAANPRRRRRRRNPGLALMANPRGRRRGGRGRVARAFGSVGNMGSQFMSALRMAIPVVIGIYGSRYLVRYFLGARDQGATGYAANAAATMGLATAARFSGQRNAAPLIAAGGAAALILRVLVDRVPQFQGGLNDYVIAPSGGMQDYVIPGQGGGMHGMGLPELDVPNPYAYNGGFRGGISDYVVPRVA